MITFGVAKFQCCSPMCSTAHECACVLRVCRQLFAGMLKTHGFYGGNCVWYEGASGAVKYDGQFNLAVQCGRVLCLGAGRS